MDIYLYNSLSKKKELFTPQDEKNVKLYVCGPTIYDDIHIGNARPLIIFDVLYRLLQKKYGEKYVKYARNITDIDDKIIYRAAEKYPSQDIETAIKELCQQTSKRFAEVTKALNCIVPTYEPRATEHIGQMRDMIEALVTKNYAYVADEHVFFDISRYSSYGQLKGISPQDLIAGHRIELAGNKRNPGDFVLWKPSKQGEPAWQSPCGIEVSGRPGWHIECSAMIEAKLGGMIDIHGGGEDLKFPHHENEIAQSCCAQDIDKLARYWLHNSYLLVDGHKMSKSLGNFITVRDVIDSSQYPLLNAAGLRLAVLQTHYRDPINWTSGLFEEAKQEIYLWMSFIRSSLVLVAQYDAEIDEFLEALCSDLNTPLAIQSLREYYKQKDIGRLCAALAVIGFNYRDIIDEIYSKPAAHFSSLAKKIIEKTQDRIFALQEGDFAESDRIRDELIAMNFEVLDYMDDKKRRRFDLRYKLEEDI